MFKRQINYEKLKFKLQICVQRLDVVLKRKKVRSLKKRKEIIHLVPDDILLFRYRYSKNTKYKKRALVQGLAIKQKFRSLT